MVHFVDWFADRSVYVLDLGLACCAIESEFSLPADSVTRTVDSIDQLCDEVVRDSARLVVVVSGTLTTVLAPRVGELVDQLRSRCGAAVSLVAFGACVCGGGPYWDSYSVVIGIDQFVPVDYYIAGCPPPPEALARTIDDLVANEVTHV